MSKSMQELLQSSQLSGGNAEYIEQLYDAYLADPKSISSEWQTFFDGLPANNGGATDVSHQSIRDYFANLAQSGQLNRPRHTGEMDKQAHVSKLINAYREHGHHHANLDPLSLTQRIHVPDLDLAYHDLNESDLDKKFHTQSALFHGEATLREIIEALEKTYCRHIGIEYMHITNQDEVAWLQHLMESTHGEANFNEEQKKNILLQLTRAEGLEKYLGSKYVGQKRFSLEGAESFIAITNAIIEKAGDIGVKEIVMGMAHRGRINVLINTLGKSPELLFEEFEGKSKTDLSGDVKYHMGFSSDLKTKDGFMHLTLAFNPSHLEIISPVVQGSVRSRLRRRGDLDSKNSVFSILVHGDAAFAGQGVVMETFNFSQARGYSTGGSIHVVINNQIGFTTSNPLDSRSTLYCTDIAKAYQAPIIHVNGDDPEACVFAALIAVDYRMKFKKDVVIDLVCYRRHGHNEADEPSTTQPVMYHIIRNMDTTLTKYANQLIAEKVVSQEEVDKNLTDLRDTLDNGKPLIPTVTGEYEDKYAVDWKPYLKTDWDAEAKTGVPLKKLKELSKIINTVPEGFKVHQVVKRLMNEREKMCAGELPLNWGFAEMMAYATLVDEGYPVRLSGQDSGRGTFSHRHAVLHESDTAELYVPLTAINDRNDQVIIIDSVLSEEAVLAFEYGYAASEPNVLVIWEAQFGDFVNGAQVVIDQFISSGEQKWGRLNGVVMFLPHGYEGQGPEHSSARLERFLQLCAQHNIQVCTPTTPAQHFHMLRRQMLRTFRKPLIVMTPKSLLRHKLAVSSLDDLTKGKFHPIIPEIDDIDPKNVRRVVLCGGKVYYDLLQRRREKEQTDVAIIRIEQLYPFPKKELKKELEKYKHVRDIVWCQEEPKNQGAWFSSRHNIEATLNPKQILNYVGRAFFAAPAVGHMALHVEQQHALVNEALN